jgi:hydrogenase maturation protease
VVVPAVANLIAVIGCGNPNRSDDGAGGEVIRRLAGRAAADVKLLDAGTDGMAVMFAARGCTTLIIIDACTTGAPPGTVYEVPAEVVAARHHRAHSLHDFRWDHALYAGRAMYRDDFPRDVVVLLVEAQSLALGLGLSDAVAAAVDQVVARVARLIEERAARVGCPGGEACATSR